MKLLFIILLVTNLYSYNLETFKFVLKREGVEFEIKSAKNWFRVVNNKEKLKKYKIKMTKNELKIVKRELKFYIKNQSRHRGIKWKFY